MFWIHDNCNETIVSRINNRNIGFVVTLTNRIIGANINLRKFRNFGRAALNVHFTSTPASQIELLNCYLAFEFVIV
jgi:hypothetical protein